MTFILLSQRDSKWAGIPLGSSTTTTIGSHGCTITGIAILAGLTPDEVNRRILAVGGYQNGNLVIWSKIKEAIPWLEFEWRNYTYEGDADNNRVKDTISKYGACLVEVDYDGKISTPRDSHWVVYIGNQRMIDPWTGIEKPTSYYPIVKGFAVIKVSAKPEVTQPQNTILDGIKFEGNLENTIKFLFTENKFSEGDIRGAMEDFKRGTVKHLEGVVANLTIERDEAINTASIATQQVAQLTKNIEQKDEIIKQNDKITQQKLDELATKKNVEKTNAVNTAKSTLKAELSPMLYYNLSGGKLVALGFLKSLGRDIKPEGVNDDEKIN